MSLWHSQLGTFELLCPLLKFAYVQLNATMESENEDLGGI